MKAFALWLLRGYKKYVSPLKGRHTCIFRPSCSVYAIEAVTEFGFVKGAALTALRLLRCVPWGKGGSDPVPYNFRGDIKWIL